MSDYLTPEEVEQTLKAMGESWFSKAEVATLRAYVKVVEAVAKKVSRESHKRIGLVIDTIPALDAALAEWEAVNE